MHTSSFTVVFIYQEVNLSLDRVLHILRAIQAPFKLGMTDVIDTWQKPSQWTNNHRDRPSPRRGRPRGLRAFYAALIDAPHTTLTTTFTHLSQVLTANSSRDL